MTENMEMERDGVAPQLAKKRPKLPEIQLDMPSLTERLQEHFHDFRTSMGPKKASSKAPHLLLPDLIAKIAVHLYFFTITATWALGMFKIMPYFYSGADSTLLYHRIFMVIVYLEMMANWLCIRYVDSSYQHYLKKMWLKRGKIGFCPSSRDGEGSLSELLENAQNGGVGTEWNQTNGATNEGVDPNTPWKPAFRPTQQASYSYWSWIPCYVCETMRPPRCHHCPVCQTCVLKRDHHCFFAGSCVGWRNQRHFLIFGVWATVACSYASYYGISYFLAELWSGMSWLDVFPPFTLVRWLLGYVSGMTCLCVWVQSLLIYFLILSSNFVGEHLHLTVISKTSFETTNLKKTIELRDVSSLGARFRAVLGRWWFFSFLCPLHWLFEVDEDPENWPSIKIYRH